MSNRIYRCPKCGRGLRPRQPGSTGRVKCPACSHVFLLQDAEVASQRRPAAKAKPVGDSCPDCKAPLPAGAVICVQCGYDRRTGQQLNAAVQTPGQTGKVRASRSDSEPSTTGDGDPRAKLGMILGLVGVALIIGSRALFGGLGCAMSSSQSGSSCWPSAPIVICDMVAACLGIAALVFGVRALLRSSRDPAYRAGRALAGGAAVAGLLSSCIPLALFLLPIFARAHNLQTQAMASSRLRTIGQAMRVYASSNNGKFPPDVAKLVDTGDLSWTDLKPIENKSDLQAQYTYIPGQTADGHPANVLVYDAHEIEGGTHVLSCDGHVDFVRSRETVEQRVAQTRQRVAGFSSRISSLAFGPDGTRLAAVDRAGKLAVWDTAAEQLLESVSAHPVPVCAVAYGHDGSRLATGGEDGTLKIWDAEQRQVVLTSPPRFGKVFDLAFSPDGKQIALSNADGTVHLLIAETGEDAFTLTGQKGNRPHIAFSPCGRLLAAGNRSSRTIWDTKNGDVVDSASYGTMISKFLAMGFHDEQLLGALYMASPGLSRKSVGVRDLAPDAQSFDSLIGLGSSSDVAVAFSPDGDRVVLARKQSVELRHIASGRKTCKFSHDREIECVSVGPDCGYVAIGDDRGRVRIWEAAPRSAGPAVRGETTGEEPGSITGTDTLVIKGHSLPVSSLCYSPDGTFVVSGDLGGTVRIWDAATFTERGLLDDHSSSIQLLVFGEDDNQLSVGTDDGQLKCWDVAVKNALKTMRVFPESKKRTRLWCTDGEHIASVHKSVLAIRDPETGEALVTLDEDAKAADTVAFSPGGALVVATYEDGVARIWDAQTGVVKLTLCGLQRDRRGGAPGPTTSFSPDGKLLASSGGRIVRIWDTGSAVRPRTLWHKDSVSTCAFSPDSSLLVSCDRKGTLRVWDVEEADEMLVVPEYGKAKCLAFSPDGTHIISGHEDHTVKKWTLPSLSHDTADSQNEDGDLLHLLREPSGRALKALVVSPDGSHIAAVGEGRLSIWNAVEGNEVLDLCCFDVCGASGGLAGQVRFSEDEPELQVVGTDADEVLTTWDFSSGQRIRTQEIGESFGCPTLSRDGTRLAVVTTSGGLSLVDSGTGERINRFRVSSSAGDRTNIRVVGISPDGRMIAAGCEDHSIRIWECSTGKALFRLTGHSRVVTSISFSPDGGRIASGSDDKTLKLWDAATGELVHSYDGYNTEAGSSLGSQIQFSPDGQYIGAGAKPVRVWNAQTGEEVVSQVLEGGSSCMAFSPDGQEIAVGFIHGAMKILSLETGQEVRELKAKPGERHSVAYRRGRGGKMVLAASADAVRSVAYCADGRLVVSACADGTIKVWKVE